MIFNSPHSGSVYPHAFLNASRIDIEALRRSEDSFMDELIADLSERGFPVMRVHFPRSYVDVNREPYELDPRMFSGRLPSFANTRSMRVAGGLGTIPRVVGDGQEIYRERLNVDDALGRIEALYKPYHRALRRLINKAHQSFGAAMVIDCHSMPSVGVSRDEPRRPDVVIGDRYGTSCAALIADVVEETMTALGYSVGRNKPYAGGFITEHYGNPATRAAHRAGGTQSRDLYGRAAARTRPALRPGRRRFLGAGRCGGGDPAGRAAAVPGGSRIAAASSQTVQNGPAGQRRSIHDRQASILDRSQPSASCSDFAASQKKKGPLACKRPKSREETPKEGSDSARRYRTATICGCGAQNASVFARLSMQNCMSGWPIWGGKFSVSSHFQ